jgi:hypothetical protein
MVTSSASLHCRHIDKKREALLQVTRLASTILNSFFISDKVRRKFKLYIICMNFHGHERAASEYQVILKCGNWARYSMRTFEL